MLSLQERFEEIRVYPVTCERLSLGRDDVTVVKELMRAGARIVQYRHKDASLSHKYSIAKELRKITLEHHALLIINDHIDLAMAIDADGVHLGQDDFPCREARRLLGPEKIIGVSCHSLEDVIQAEQDGASYANLGPIFATQTKENTVAPLGLEAFQRISEQVTLPLTVMGGIHRDELPGLLRAGARRIAMVSELVSSRDIFLSYSNIKTYIDNILISL